MTAPRWQVIAESGFPWEREALEWLRGQLPDRDPWLAWSNFEFIDDEGKVNEVDLLLLAPTGLYLIEIKSRPGVVSGDTHTWTWRTDGREYTYDNPLILANRKAKRLASVLRRQSTVKKARVRVPWVEPLIFLSATSLNCKLEDAARARVYLRGQPGASHDPGIVGALLAGVQAVPGSDFERLPAVDHAQTRAVKRALIEAGVRPSNKHRRVGDYALGALISEGEGFQDWEASHVSVGAVRRRIRIYGYAAAANEQARVVLTRQAHREFQILEGIDHPGILKVRDYNESELGPALIFDHDPGAVRLDFLLREAGGRLGVDARLHIVRQLAETLKYAHSKRLYHRALGPQSVLVRDAGSAEPRLQIMNWQTAAREPVDGGTILRNAGTEGTIHVDEYVDNPGLIYLAPESTLGSSAQGPAMDIFSLGAIAYHVFAGCAPAASLAELYEKLRAGPGLLVSDALDGAGQALQDLIRYSTVPDLDARFGSVDEFLLELDSVEEELTRPDPEATADPARATAGERLEGGFTVLRRLGKGSSSDVLLVKADGDDEERVLKVASEVAHNERLEREGEVLARLRHPNVVRWHRTLTVSGRIALLMDKADRTGEGDATLAKRLRGAPRLSLDLIQRFGDELIGVVDYLEQQGVPHRDIKPENIGISQAGANGKLQLVLFDFSLSSVSPENIGAGTHPYLDPFLSLRRPPRWDLYAERYALAVTLYEMVTGEPPRWGDGKTAPAMLEDEVTIDAERFDPHLREAFVAFFERALRRDFRQRFDNAEEMQRAWRRVFEGARSLAPNRDSFDAVAETATATTTMGELGYSVEAQSVLEGMGIHTVRELLAVPRIEFRHLKGVGDKVRKEIRLKAKRLALLRADLARGRGTLHASEPGAERVASVDELAAQLLPRRPAGDERVEDVALACYLGLEAADATSIWPTLGDATRNAGIARSQANEALLKARQRWLKDPAITAVRNDLDALVQAHGGVLTARECALALLGVRGSIQDDDGLRSRLAGAVVRAALEAEAGLATLRYQVFENDGAPLIATNVDLADYAKRLGHAADEAAQADPLLAPQRALELLEAVARPPSVAPFTAQRLLRLATAASRKAALSSRLEIYPRGMPAAQALRQSLGALTGVRSLTVGQLTQRVQGRYPQAGLLPPRPALDVLLAAAGAGLQWVPGEAGQEGSYCSVGAFDPSVGATTALSRHGTFEGGPDEPAPDVLEAASLEERLEYSQRTGGFLALTVPPPFARRAEAELLQRYPRERVSLDSLLLKAMKQSARAARADWNVVLAADAAQRGSRDWTNLMRLVGKAAREVKDALLERRAPLLLVNPGLLARYELMAILEELRDASGRPGAPPSVWLLVPMAANALPAVDGVAVPLISASQWARVPQAWLENRHRAAAHALTQ